MHRIIQRQQTDPYFNLAAEEYFMKQATVDTFMTWRNDTAVIIGKHQNTSREINHRFIASKNIPVIRRITGGGTVYHDPGNLNFSFIYTNRKENLIDFREFTAPVIEFLETLGLDANFEGKNNIVLDGLKVSGNSAHIYKNKVLHHGTLLFNSNLLNLKESIQGEENQYDDRAVRSVRAQVGNISDMLADEITIDEFNSLFIEFISGFFGEADFVGLSGEEIKIIESIAADKYRSLQWNYGYSPEYDFTSGWYDGNEEYSIHLNVKEGIILKASLNGPEWIAGTLKQAEKIIEGKLHIRKELDNYLDQFPVNNGRERKIVNQIINHLF